MTDLIKQVENDEITDITPYLENEEFLKELAKKGLLYDQYIDTKYVDVLITLITNGYAKEYYHILAYHENIDVRYTLAENGYELDILSQDKEPEVLTGVLYSDDSYIPNYLTRKSSHHSEWYIVRGYLRHQRNPKLQYLKLFLETPIPEKANKASKQSIYYKYQSMTCPVTTIEKTMSIAQLYATGGTLWARELTSDEIQYVFIIEQEFLDIPRYQLAPYIEKLLSCRTSSETRETKEEMKKRFKINS